MANLADGAAAGDALGRGVTEARVLADGAAASDALGPVFLRGRMLADNASAYDSLNPYPVIPVPPPPPSVPGPGIIPGPPPGPLPPGWSGPSGNHLYEVIPTDSYGVPFGVINDTMVKTVTWELDGIGGADVSWPTLEPSGALMPMSQIPFGREIQIWRDGVLIQWCGPVTPAVDKSAVDLQCSGLTWLLGQENFGPEVNEFLLDPDFEVGTLSNWAVVGAVSAREDQTVNSGKHAARLINIGGPEDSYLHQYVTLSAPAAEPTLYIFSAWYFIDPRYGAFVPALQNRGLFVQAVYPGPNPQVVPQYAQSQISASAVVGQWTRIETQFFVPAGEIILVDLRLYAVQNGSIIWDTCQLREQESVGTPVGGGELLDLVDEIVAYAQDPARGKSPHVFAVYGQPTGYQIERHYQFSDNGNVLDALNELPTIGACDFGAAWTSDGRQRGIAVYFPAQGELNYEWPIVIKAGEDGAPNVASPRGLSDTVGTITDLRVGLDGSKTKTAARVLGQGSTGANREIGYAAFPSYLGGRIAGAAGSTVQGSKTLTCPGANFTSADLGQGIYVLAPGVLAIGTTVAAIISATQVTLSKAALITEGSLLVGVGGVVLDDVKSAQPDYPVATLGSQALTQLNLTKTGLVTVTVKVQADGPAGYFGRVHLGDVVPVVVVYGWIQVAQLMRIVKMVLYPPTEELELKLNVVAGFYGSFGFSG